MHNPITRDSLQVELIAHASPNKVSGIGRYISELYQHLQAHIPVRLASDIMPPLAKRLSILENFPIGVQDHQPGAIVHFAQIMGCALMLYKPLRPAVATVHDLGVLVCPEDEVLFDRVGRAVLNVQLEGLKRMNAWIAVSRTTAQDLIERLGVPANRVHTVYHHIDPALFRPTQDAYLALPDGMRFKTDRYQAYLLYVGSELPRKNLVALLRGLKLLKQRGYALRLIKVGRSGGVRWREMFLRQVHEQGLCDDVLLLEQVDEAILPLIYNAADLFVTTSLMEGFGYPVLEAMACGTPVIASRIGSLPEIAGDAAIWIDDPRDPRLVADRIAQGVDAPESRSALRQNGLTRAGKFTAEQAISETLKVYQSIV
jgi:glycosyltransferase involved in cell wall biosynthesis